MAASSPFFKTLPLEQHGLKFINPLIPLAHPFDDGTATLFYQSPEVTAQALGEDRESYVKLMTPIVNDWPRIAADVLAPFHLPKHPFAMAGFGLHALRSATHMAKRFVSKQARGLWMGMAAHAMQSLSNATTSAVALVLMAAGHTVGWPLAKRRIKCHRDALGSYFDSMGASIKLILPYVQSLSQLPSSHALLFDVTPRQLLEAGHKFSIFFINGSCDDILWNGCVQN
jgi:phytoene dehydrogenase-like protein